MMAKSLGSALNEPLEPLDPIASREERRATGRMVAVIVALLMIFCGFYHAWIKRIPVLAGVMVPALIMLLYAAWVLFLAKRDKQRRLNAENHIRSSLTALSDVLIVPPADGLAERRLSHCSERRLSHCSDRRLSQSSVEHMRIHPSSLQLMLMHQHKLQEQHQHHHQSSGGRRAHRHDRKKHTHQQNHHHHHQQQHNHSRRGSAAQCAEPSQPHTMRRPSLVPLAAVDAMQLSTAIVEHADRNDGGRRPSLVRSLSAR